MWGHLLTLDGPLGGVANVSSQDSRFIASLLQLIPVVIKVQI